MEAFVPRGASLGKGFTDAEKTAGMEIHPDHRASKGKSAASWITDLLSLRKVLILCPFCRVKFNPRHYSYRRVFVPDATGKTDGYSVNGDCDGCGIFTANVGGGGTAFQAEEDYLKTHIDPTVARRQARAGAKALGTWDFVRKHT